MTVLLILFTVRLCELDVHLVTCCCILAMRNDNCETCRASMIQIHVNSQSTGHHTLSDHAEYIGLTSMSMSASMMRLLAHQLFLPRTAEHKNSLLSVDDISPLAPQNQRGWYGSNQHVLADTDFCSMPSLKIMMAKLNVLLGLAAHSITSYSSQNCECLCLHIAPLLLRLL